MRGEPSRFTGQPSSSATVAATVAEALGCPVKRLGSPRIPVGYAPTLEAEARVGSTKIGAAVRTWLEG